ncbi:MAG: copper homeostasis protein CutC [Chitinophagaceae bacterium]|nr:MAG: copper homeostasis protein CutC [Chitinophagaceae bacterium]
MSYLIEIATTDFATTRLAVAGGADRIELCSALSEGGLTPSFGMLRLCREQFGVALFSIIRPRGGDFRYSGEELAIMEEDIRRSKELGCDGIVVGMLKKDGTLPRKKLAHFVELAWPMEVTFHRAFDRCRDPFEALEDLIELGFQRILTSGQQLTAPEGASLIAQLVKAAGERIVIMPGSGVRPDNIKALAEQTGAFEFHSSLRSRVESTMEFRHPSFPEKDFQLDAIDPEEVRLLRQNLAS